MAKRDHQAAQPEGLGASQKQGPGASLKRLVRDPIIICGGGSEFQIVDQVEPGFNLESGEPETGGRQ